MLRRDPLIAILNFSAIENMLSYLSHIPLAHALLAALLKWPRGLDGVKNTNLGKHVFTTYSASQPICIDAFRPWWIGFYPLRVKKYELSEEILALPLPEPLPYRAPVQVINARALRASKSGGLVYVEGGRWIHRHTVCLFHCEDVRSAIELWLSEHIEAFSHIRDKGPIKMQCPEGQYIVVDKVPDIREIETPMLKDLDKLVIEMEAHKPNGYQGPDSYPSFVRPLLHQKIRRKAGKYVEQCRCVKEIPMPKLPKETKTKCVDLSSSSSELRSDDDIEDVLHKVYQHWLGDSDIEI